MNLLLGNESCGITRALGSVQVLNEGSGEELECQGYRSSSLRRVLFYLSILCTLGFILLVMRWKPQLGVYLTKTPCPLVKADTVLLKDESGTYFVEKIESFTVDTSGRLESMILQQADIRDVTDDDNSDSDVVAGTDHSLNLIESDKETTRIRYFDHHHIRYMWNRQTWLFQPIQGLDHAVECSSLSADYTGWSEQDQKERRKFYGDNAIDIHVKSYWKLFIDEVLNPFYIFQVFSVILWSTDEYYYYAACIVLISAVSIAISLYEMKRQSVTLCEKVASKFMEVKVCRGSNVWMLVDSRSLVPGDLIALTVVSNNELTMPCDAVVLSGNAIVNESMLTGESVPEKKSPLVCHNKTELYDISLHKRHTLFSGTRIIQTSGDKNTVQALVLRTGFKTTKGELVRSILFPKPVAFQFYRDSIKFIMFLAIVAACGMTFSIVILIFRKTTVSEIIIRTLDIITITVPPALPAAMTIGTVYAQNRLKKQDIFCISPPRINFCGKIKLFCFDKTGTLTEDGLDMWGVVPTADKRFGAVVRDPREMQHGPMLSAMATCHSIVMINGERSGDPLDVIMFESIGWIIENTSRYEQLVDTVVTPMSNDMFTDNEQPPLEIATLKEFPFSSALQRMSVITKSNHSERIEVFCKGAPEKIASLCVDSSVPHDFAEVLHKFTVQGFRVIALAWKRLTKGSRWHQVLRLSREDVESDLQFLGLIILQNALKPETNPVIHQLSSAQIRTVMVTGDNILTAISVARKCHMVDPDDAVIEVDAVDPDDGSPPRITLNVLGQTKSLASDQDVDGQVVMEIPSGYHLAISGKSFGVIFEKYSTSLLAALCVRGTIFARMSPSQKQQLIEALQNLGYYVGMCGDGANDCGALKMAHAGISLSEEEASVASPFTSKVQNIECVPTLIREGRAALVTSFGCFKYMALYSMIQFVSVLILYWFQTNLSNLMFIYIDLFVTTTVAVFMGYTAAYHKLVRQRPRGSLVNIANLLNIALQIVIVTVFQVFALIYLRKQAWYKPAARDREADVFPNYETTVIFGISAYQYIIMAFVFSKGPPYRKRVWTNWMFFASLVALTACTTFLVFTPAAFTSVLHAFTFKFIPNEIFKITIVTLAAINLLLSFIVEYLLEDSALMKRLLKRLRNKKDSKHKYKQIEKQLSECDGFPTIEYLSKCYVNL